MQISTQQIVSAVASMTEGLHPSERTLQLIRELAYTYRVSNGKAYSLN